VGQSGSGKVLLPTYLPFYDVQEGTIAIDNTNIKDMNLQSLGLMGLVTQDSILFNDTIKANIV
jgi:subfamily B ATP-binding cassette protein MsbA